MPADLEIHTCVKCGQTFLTTNPFQHTCPGACSLEPTWECADCHRFFTRETDPHTQHDPACPATPEGFDHEACFEHGCTWEDVCDTCCTVCHPVSSETFPPTERLDLS